MTVRAGPQPDVLRLVLAIVVVVLILILLGVLDPHPAF